MRGAHTTLFWCVFFCGMQSIPCLSSSQYEKVCLRSKKTEQKIGSPEDKKRTRNSRPLSGYNLIVQQCKGSAEHKHQHQHNYHDNHRNQ